MIDLIRRKVIFFEIIRFCIFFFLTLSGGMWGIMRAIAWLFWLPLDIVIWCTNITGIFTRSISMILLHKHWQLNIKKSLPFIIPWVIGWVITWYLLTIIDQKLLLFVVWCILLISGIYQLCRNLLPYKKISLKISTFWKKVIWYIIYTLTELITQISGWWWLLQNKTLQIFFDLSPLQATAVRKSANIFKALSLGITMIMLWKWDITIFFMVFIPACLWTYFGTKYFIKKWDEFIDRMLILISILFWLRIIWDYFI